LELPALQRLFSIIWCKDGYGDQISKEKISKKNLEQNNIEKQNFENIKIRKIDIPKNQLFESMNLEKIKY
jgi:hypothetical protein